MKRILCKAGMILMGSLFCFSTGVMAQSNDDSYIIVDLQTGNAIEIEYDADHWMTMNKATGEPVEYYVIKYNNNPGYDTIHGVTGLVVNNMIWMDEEGKWKFDDSKVKWDGDELKMKDKYGRKVKWEKGELKIKDWNSKYKYEKGDDTKYKEEWSKVKWKDGEVKVENGTKKNKMKNDNK